MKTRAPRSSATGRAPRDAGLASCTARRGCLTATTGRWSRGTEVPGPHTGKCKILRRHLVCPFLRTSPGHCGKLVDSLGTWCLWANGWLHPPGRGRHPGGEVTARMWLICWIFSR